MSVLVRYLSICLTAITVIVFAVIFFGDDSKSETEKAQMQKKELQRSVSEQYMIYFNFEGDQTQIIDLIKGTASLKMVYVGSTKFSAKLLNTDGTLLAILADETGPFNGKMQVEIPETTSYLLNVQTKGEWSLSRE